MKVISNKKKILVFVFTFVMLLIIFLLVWIFVINKTLVPGKSGHYTYRYADESPNSLNPLTWSTDSERDVLSYTTSSLYDIVSDENNSVQFVPELATALPEDVTAEYAGNEVYGVPDDATEGYAYRITIREDALWEDGTAITAEDFDYSLQLYLSDCSTHQSDYYNSFASLANAADYTGNSYVCAYDSDTGYVDLDDSELYFSLTQVNALLATCSLEDYYTWYSQDKATLFIDDNSHNIYEKLQDIIGDEEYIKLTEDIKTLLQAFCKNYGLSDENGYKRLCFYKDDEKTVSWEQVGFIVEDDNTMVFVLSKQVDTAEFAYALSDLMLVKQDLYEQNSDEYGASIEAYQSYGPYIITAYDEDNLVLEQNDNWFGYSDDSYEGQYQTTDIEISFDLTDDEAEAKFIEGSLDDLEINESMKATYENSQYLYTLSDTAENILFLNTNFLELKEKNTEGENHTILSYMDFRHAVALLIDRGDYMTAVEADGEEAYGLLGRSYIADISSMTAYRDTSYASEVLDSVWGEADENGSYLTYDVEKAAQLLQNAYEACMMDGNIQGTDTIILDFYSENAQAAEYLQEAFTVAAAGTSLEGKIIIRSVDNQETADIWESELSGSEWDLCEYMQYFLDADYAVNDGFSLNILKCTIAFDDDKISMTYSQWYQALTQGDYCSVSADTQTKVLAYLEKGLLLNYQSIPLYSTSETHMHSQRITFAEEYMDAESGNIRYMTYTMDDREWAKYCKSLKNELEY